MTKYEMIKDVLQKADEKALIALYNEYDYHEHDGAGEIFYMHEFNDYFFETEALEIVRMCQHSSFCPEHKYFWFVLDGDTVVRIESADSIGSDRICIDDIATYVERTGNPLYNDEIWDILYDE